MHNIMNTMLLAAILLAAAGSIGATSPRTVKTLRDGWQFSRGHGADATEWTAVHVPHDWAIYGPFDRSNDLQVVAVEQNGEKFETAKTGRTGGLPLVGKATYRTTFNVADTAGRTTTLVFDGAMSHANVSVNGRKVAYWPYGYNSFFADVSDRVVPGENQLTVELENYERASRWYSGAGLYRNVHVVSTSDVHIPVWGTYVTTPSVDAERASVRLAMDIAGVAKGEKIMVTTNIYNPKGEVVAADSSVYVGHGQEFVQNFLVENPLLWSPETPALYKAETTLMRGDSLLDRYATRFGIRKLEYIPERGFSLNGVATKFKGVCNHHDLGPLGAAINRSALNYRLSLLKDMGVNAIRTAHNMPSPELVELCDEMGIMLMVEPFDDWSYRPKSPNGYGRYFNEWAERDVTNMVRRYRNNPSVVMWSIGNEVPSQRSPEGIDELTMLSRCVKSLDTTRPITCGMDQLGAVLENGFAAALDIPGFNYKPQYYDEIYRRLPQKMVLGSETASTVSSRGVYQFPLVMPDETGRHTAIHPDNQSSSYDNESCAWSNTPDIDFFMDDTKPWMLGQFVWTGFDYLGEPSPYDTDAWPSHSSLFGIIDLASIPKNRYYLYRSQWNAESPTLHVLPHWTWPGREGEPTPVMVYTSYPTAEMFVNGESRGVREKNDSSYVSRVRLIWDDVVYHPGELRVVAYDENGLSAAEQTVRTAGAADHLVVVANRDTLRANGDDLAFFTIRVADKDGNLIPNDSRDVRFAVSGSGTFEATANGDPTSLRSFQQPVMDLFSGAATAIVRSLTTPGAVTLSVAADGLPTASLTLPVVAVE